jgi:hypothetical protein
MSLNISGLLLTFDMRDEIVATNSGFRWAKFMHIPGSDFCMIRSQTQRQYKL